MIAKGILRHPRVTLALTALSVAAGLFCMRRLPVEEFPNVAPPSFQVTARADGLNASDANRAVAVPLEEAFLDLPGVLYRSSVCTDSGFCQCDVTFRTGVSPETALHEIKEAIRRAEGRLPAAVRSRGIDVIQGLDDTVTLYAFSAEGGGVPDGVAGAFRTRILGVEGVESVEISGERTRTVRIVFDPVKLSGLQMTMPEVAEKLSACRAGGGEVSDGNGEVRIEGLVSHIGDFGEVVVREDAKSGGRVLVKDIARIEVEESTDNAVTLDGREVVLMRVRKRADSHASEVAERVKALVDGMMKDLPKGVSCALVADAASGARTFMRDVAVTPLVSLVLVGLVLLLFWRSVRMAVVPFVVAMASIVASFVLQSWFSFTFNALTVFGFVLVIGSLVDTALIVIARARFGMLSSGLPPRVAMEDAVRRSFGVMVASTVLVAVCYVPLAFMPGMVSRLHLQFAFTSCMALALSAVFALTLAPVLFSFLVRDDGVRSPGGSKQPPIPRGWASVCQGVAGWFIRHPSFAIVLLVAAVSCLVPFKRLLPKMLFGKDRVDRVVVEVALQPESARLRTERVCDEAACRLKELKDVKHVLSVVGQSALYGSGDCFGRLTVEFLRRLSPKEANEVCADIRKRLASIAEARICVFTPSPVRGVGRFDGLEFSLCGRGCSAQALADVARSLAGRIEAMEGVHDVMCAIPANGHRVKLDIDHAKTSAFGILPEAASSAIRDAIAPLRLGGFSLADGACEVVLSKSDSAATEPDALERLLLPAAGGAFVPVSALGKVSVEAVPQAVARFNGADAIGFVVRLAPGASPERLVEAISATELPKGFSVAWSGIAVQESVNRGGTRILVGLALFAVYLLLAAWYESWTLPLPVVGTALVAILGSLAGLASAGLPLDIHAQVALVVVVGIAVKLSVLIVGSARNRFLEGKPAEVAAEEGMKRTFRPVQLAAWTSLAGCVPLLFAVGVGTGEQFVMGVVAVSGVAATILAGLVLTPALYVVAERLNGKLGGPPIRIRRRRPRKGRSN